MFFVLFNNQFCAVAEIVVAAKHNALARLQPLGHLIETRILPSDSYRTAMGSLAVFSYHGKYVFFISD